MARGTQRDDGETWVDGILVAINGEPVVEVVADDGPDAPVVDLTTPIEDAPETPLPAAYLEARRQATLLGLGLVNGEEE